jgi:alpha-beta hydrolase superfamily lysophospholipase
MLEGNGRPDEELVESGDGVRIFVRSWRPGPSPRAVVVICHGVNSHGGQYLWTGRRLAAHGFAVYALDLRGRGQSEGERYYVDDVAEYVSDVAAVIGLAQARDRGVPVFLLGHSAGGVVACTFALEHQAQLAGLISESFAFRVPAPGFALSLIKWVSRIAPRLPVLKLDNRDFTRDPVALSALEADPLTRDEIQPTGTVAALARAAERLAREFPRLTLPVLILHGTVDRATVPSGSQFFHDTVGSRDKTLRLYDGHYHDLLNDVGKEEVMADITGWIDRRLRGA